MHTQKYTKIIYKKDNTKILYSVIFDIDNWSLRTSILEKVDFSNEQKETIKKIAKQIQDIFSNSLSFSEKGKKEKIIFNFYDGLEWKINKKEYLKFISPKQKQKITLNHLTVDFIYKSRLCH